MPFVSTVPPPPGESLVPVTIGKVDRIFTVHLSMRLNTGKANGILTQMPCHEDLAKAVNGVKSERKLTN